MTEHHPIHNCDKNQRLNALNHSPAFQVRIGMRITLFILLILLFGCDSASCFISTPFLSVQRPFIIMTDSLQATSSNMTTTTSLQETSNHNVKPRFLPDLDDESMTYVFAYIKDYEHDLVWSFLSDFCFVLGSILYLCLAYYDYIGKEPICYYALDFLAPLSFLGNSLIDIQWANQVKQRHQVKKDMKFAFEQAAPTTPLPPKEEDTNTTQMVATYSETHGTSKNNLCRSHVWYCRLFGSCFCSTGLSKHGARKFLLGLV